LGVLAYLELARAYAVQGDQVNAGSMYRQFLDLWKSADSDIPALKQARAEFAKLNERTGRLSFLRLLHPP
jgi:eukaryotic-like serine/threonine-protein kinase